MRARRNSVFVRDPLSISGTLDRNQRARLMAYAEALERRTKAPGRPNGCLGWVGLRVLKCLLWGFLGPRGCFPSYDRLQEASGLCRQSIANGIKRLEACGLLRVVRRLVRVRIGGIVMTRQASNCYGFASLETLAKTWTMLSTTGPSLRDRRDHTKEITGKGLSKQEPAEPARQELHRGDLGELAAIVTKRLRKAAPDWRTPARAMSLRKG